MQKYSSPKPRTRIAAARWNSGTGWKRANWRNFAEVRGCFPATDKVGDKFVFDVGGNKLRLIAAIHFNTGRVFVRAVLTHHEYDKGDWK